MNSSRTNLGEFSVDFNKMKLYSLNTDTKESFSSRIILTKDPK